MSLYRHLRLAPLLALGSWFFTTHCSDPLADDCRRKLTCGDEAQGFYSLDPNCVWHYPDGTVWEEGPRRIDGAWYWSDGTPVGRTFECGAGGGISVPGNGGSGGSGGTGGDGGTGGTGGDGMGDAGPPPEPPPPTPDCNTNLTCAPPTQCEESTGNCVGCVDDTPCAGTIAPRCSGNTCVACIADTDCSTAGFSRCDLSTNTCQPCTDTAQCGHIAGATQCNPTLTGGKCVQCLTEAQCEGLTGTEQCKEETGSCVQCTDDVHCEGDRDNSRCDLTTNTCKPCANDNQCPDATPLCDVDGQTARCVACLGNTGPSTCQNPALANCDTNGDCVACTNSSQCTHLGQNLGVCNINNGRCVQCVTNDDCDSPTASQCVGNVCVECTRNGQTSVGCDGAQPGGTVCDTNSNPNQCVQCTGTDFTACNGFVCNSTLRTCSTFAPASAEGCEPCVSDAQCLAGNKCYQQRFANTNIGLFCLPLAVAGDCGTRPFVGLNDTLISIDRDETAACELRQTTCPALTDMNNLVECDVQGVAQSSRCGFQGVDDGVCVQFATDFLCTVPCGTTNDCPGSNCSTSAPFLCAL